MFFGIRDILIIAKLESLHLFQRLPGDGSDFALRLSKSSRFRPNEKFVGAK